MAGGSVSPHQFSTGRSEFRPAASQSMHGWEWHSGRIETTVSREMRNRTASPVDYFSCDFRQPGTALAKFLYYGVKNMDKHYLIYKCFPGKRKRPLTCLTAFNLEEAHQALQWLQKHHEQEMNFKLGEGEFFEILEESHILPEEWQEAMEQLKMEKSSAHEANGVKAASATKTGCGLPGYSSHV